MWTEFKRYKQLLKDVCINWIHKANAFARFVMFSHSSPTRHDVIHPKQSFGSKRNPCSYLRCSYVRGGSVCHIEAEIKSTYKECDNTHRRHRTIHIRKAWERTNILSVQFHSASESEYVINRPTTDPNQFQIRTAKIQEIPTALRSSEM